MMITCNTRMASIPIILQSFISPVFLVKIGFRKHFLHSLQPNVDTYMKTHNVGGGGVSRFWLVASRCEHMSDLGHFSAILIK